MDEEEKMLKFCMPILVTNRTGFIGNALLTPKQAKDHNFVLCQRLCIHNHCWVALESDQSSFECDGIIDLQFFHVAFF